MRKLSIEREIYCIVSHRGEMEICGVAVQVGIQKNVQGVRSIRSE